MNPLVTQDIEKKDTNVRKPLFQPVTDKEGMTKEVADLSEALKQIFFENKQIQKQTETFDKKRRVAMMQLERTMKERNLVRINGILQPKPDFTTSRHKVNNDDIPDYDKVKQK